MNCRTLMFARQYRISVNTPLSGLEGRLYPRIPGVQNSTDGSRQPQHNKWQ